MIQKWPLNEKKVIPIDSLLTIWVSFFVSLFSSFDLFVVFSFNPQTSQPRVVSSALSLFLSSSHSLIREACVCGAELWCWSGPCGSGA